MFFMTDEVMQAVEEARKLDREQFNEKVLPTWTDQMKRYAAIATQPHVLRNAKRVNLTVPEYLNEEANMRAYEITKYMSFAWNWEQLEQFGPNNKLVHVMTDFTPNSFITNFYTVRKTDSVPMPAGMMDLAVACGADYDTVDQYKHFYTIALIWDKDGNGWSRHS